MGTLTPVPSQSFGPMIPDLENFYCRRRVSEMKNSSFSFPSRGGLKKVQYPAALPRTRARLCELIASPGLALRFNTFYYAALKKGIKPRGASSGGNKRWQRVTKCIILTYAIA